MVDIDQLLTISLCFNCLFGNNISCKTFDMQIENTSDHLPITLELNYPTSSLDIITGDFASDL